MTDKKMTVELTNKEALYITTILNCAKQLELEPIYELNEEGSPQLSKPLRKRYSDSELDEVRKIYDLIEKNRQDTFFGGLPF